MGDKRGRQVWETSVETSVGGKCGRQVGDKCKIMRPKTPRLKDKCGRQVEDKCKLMRPKAPRVRDKCRRQVGDKCKLMPPKAPRVGDKTSVENKCRRQV